MENQRTRFSLEKLFLLILFGPLLAGCNNQQATNEKKESVQEIEAIPAIEVVTGVLMHFPENVQSIQAWYGHNYMVGNKPVIPTEEVPEDVLKTFVGLNVIVQGIWYPGEKWSPAEEEQLSSARPADSVQDETFRGDGIMISSIEKAEE
ncbi:MAG: hypothetical protein CMJ76_00870 [Planctomycetaceae bacterium]|nr:hypothetical protein [Planctomycetaceae bacterium]|tara:strand:- start:1069 stop:1515 length:447 start_codon:yes stop_codon:yes gene_type:complete